MRIKGFFYLIGIAKSAIILTYKFSKKTEKYKLNKFSYFTFKVKNENIFYLFGEKYQKIKITLKSLKMMKIF